ncbi:MAG: hypothetical protein WC146_00595 [Patescibacteria group bacterium]|jgi:hypothetical protein
MEELIKISDREWDILRSIKRELGFSFSKGQISFRETQRLVIAMKNSDWSRKNFHDLGISVIAFLRLFFRIAGKNETIKQKGFFCSMIESRYFWGVVDCRQLTPIIADYEDIDFTN